MDLRGHNPPQSLGMNITGSPSAIPAHQNGANDSHVVLKENSFGATVN